MQMQSPTSRWISFRNDYAGTIPGYAIMQVTGTVAVEGQNVLTVTQPNTKGSSLFVVNNRSPVYQGTSSNQQYGDCTLDFPAEILYSGATPSAGDRYGPKANSWSLSKGSGVGLGIGYYVLGAPNSAGTRAWFVTTSLPLLGKATENIPMRTNGTCDIWSGTPGSETNQNLSPVPSFFNQTQRTITNGKWVYVSGQYIIESIETARIIKVTLTADLDVGGSSAKPKVDSFYDGDDPANLPGTLTIYPKWTQQATITSGSKVQAAWNDVLQQYEADDWTCP